MSESKLQLTVKEIERTAKLRCAVTYMPNDKKFYYGNAQQADLQQRTGQLIGVSEIEAIEAKDVLQEVLGRAVPQFVLASICRPIRMNNLSARIDVQTGYAGQRKVAELVEAQIVKAAYTPVQFDLWKNVVHLAISDEARLRAAHDIFGQQTDDAANELARMENMDIADATADVTEIAGHDWATGTNNPYEDLGAAMDAIEEAEEPEKGYPVDFIAAHSRVWLDFFSNPFVKGTEPVRIPEATSFGIPGLPGVQGYSDRRLSNTIALVGSRRAPALVLGEGPIESARYRNEPSGYDAFIIRQWLQPQLLIADGIRKLTGVHA
jgi:hypothetical protein